MGPRGDAIVEFDWCVGRGPEDARRRRPDREHARHLHQRQRPGRRRRLQGPGGRETRRPQAGRPVPRRQVQQVRGRDPRAPDRPLAGPRQARNLVRTGQPGRFPRRLRRPHRPIQRPPRLPRQPEPARRPPRRRPRGRESFIEHANGLAVRRGPWKFIPASKGPRINSNTNTELGNDPAPQLYDLATDPGETRNVAADHPDILNLLRQDLTDR